MLVVLVTFAVLVPTALAGRDAAAPLVEVAEGRVLGVTETSTKGREFHSYYGIPFAKPPVGELRLQDPVQAERWEGVRDGSRTPSPCLLVPLAYAAMGVTLAPEDLRGNEDCLYLNVFTPKTETSKNYPVMVWIHGGAYLAGGAYEYRPHVLMNHDIVLVVLQYRVGIMGFLSTEDEVIPGNFGLKDQTLALRWVQDNIHSFGGDADRVTIFGESAGGASVHYHILSPKSKGLFSRAIMQSGSALAPWARHEQHRRVAKEVSKAVGCSKAFGHKYEILDCLQEVDGRKLAARFQDFMEWFILPAVALPLVDGDFVPDLPARLMQVGAFNQVDLMAGITRDEGALVTNPMLARKDLFPALQNNFPVFGPVSLMVRPEIDDALVFSTKVYQHYLGNATIDRDHIKELTKMNTDYSFAVPHDLTTLYHARVPGLATYRYELKHRSQLSMGDFFKTNIGRQYWNIYVIHANPVQLLKSIMAMNHHVRHSTEYA
ncbi:juvenile hormone esterase isoform X2 [Penaeus vannamei]|uniref:juvenile hormone esterase isoform X2 n=1 Tax=Penaeus vannamei TaxID=6689 RepID=UPI00387F94D9